MPSKHWKEAAMYAEDMARYDEPWKYWEVRGENSDWLVLGNHPLWDIELIYRRIPRTIRIGEYDVPEPMMKAPRLGQSYFLVNLCAKQDNRKMEDYCWRGDRWDNIWLSHGICHLTSEAAELHAKALLSFTRRDE